jgi:hypothetical protein
MEMQVELNTPGQADGVIRGWVDGVLSYEKPMLFFVSPATIRYTTASSG